MATLDVFIEGGRWNLSDIIVEVLSKVGYDINLLPKSVSVKRIQ